MSSIQAFRCGRCRAEVLATARRAAPYWSIGPDHPVLCCGQPLRPLELGQVLSVPLPRRRLVRCPRCGYAVWVIVQPVGALVCAGYQAECVVAPPDTRATMMEGALGSGRVSQGAR